MEHIRLHIDTYACPSCDYRFTLTEFTQVSVVQCPRKGCDALLMNFKLVKAQPRKEKK